MRWQNRVGEQAPSTVAGRLLESINQTKAATWEGHLTARPTDESSKEIVGELVSLAAVSFFEDTSDWGTYRSALLDPNKSPSLPDEDWIALSGSESRTWLADCRPYKNKPFETFDGALYTKNKDGSTVLRAIVQAKYQDADGGEFKEWFNVNTVAGKRIADALEEGIAVYYITPGGNPTLDASLLEEFTGRGGKVLNRADLSGAQYGEDFMVHLKRMLKLWADSVAQRDVEAERRPDPPPPRGVQLAVLNRLRPLFRRGGVRSDAVLGTGSGKSITGFNLVGEQKKTVVFVDGQHMVPQMISAMRKSGVLPADTRYSWISSSPETYPGCTKITCSRRVLTDATRGGETNKSKNKELGQIDLTRSAKGIEYFKGLMASDRTEVVLCLYESAPVLLELVCFHAKRRFDLAIMDEVHVVSSKSRSSKDACHFVALNNVGLTATQEMVHVFRKAAEAAGEAGSGGAAEGHAAMTVEVAEGTSEGVAEDVVLAKQRGMMTRAWLLENKLSLSTEHLKAIETGGEWQVADGDQSADRPDNKLLNHTDEMQSAHPDGSIERVVRLDDDGDEGDEVEDEVDDAADATDEDDDGADETNDDESVEEGIEGDPMDEAKAEAEAVDEDVDMIDSDLVDAPVGVRSDTEEDGAERSSKKQKRMIDVRRLSDLTERDDGRRWETIPELEEEEGRLLWMCFQGIVSSEDRAEIEKLPAYFERCEAPPPGAPYSELDHEHLVVSETGARRGAFMMLPKKTEKKTEKKISWIKRVEGSERGAVDVYVKGRDVGETVWYKGSSETVKELFEKHKTDVKLVCNQHKGTLVLQDFAEDVHFLEKRLTRTCEFVLPQGQSVELGYTLPGRIYAFIVPRELQDQYSRAIERVDTYAFVSGTTECLDRVHASVEHVHGLLLKNETDEGKQTLIQTLLSSPGGSGSGSGSGGAAGSSAPVVGKKQLKEIVSQRHKNLVHPKTAKLLKQHKTFWDALRGMLFPASKVTRTLNRTVYSVGDLTTAIGAFDFMREEPKKKMLVKNSTTDMSDATVGLLTAVAKHVVPDLPPPEQIHYKVNPASERRDRLNRFAGLPEGVLGVVGMVTQGTDIPSLNVLLNWEAPISKPARVIETYVYSRAHVQLVGRPCRKDPKNPEKTCWYYCLPGVELETEEVASKEQLVELLKTMASKDFGVYSTYSVFNKEHSNDGGVTFFVPAKRGMGGVGRGGDGGGSKQLQSGQAINEALTIELEAKDIEDIRACIEARELDQRAWLPRYEAHRDAIVNGTDKKKKKKWARAASAATPSKDAWKGLFGTTSEISAEATVGVRRSYLLTKKAEFDADCQEFHDYYLEHLKYDFRAEWEENRKKKEQKDERTWPQKYEAHRDAIVNGTDEKKKKTWAKAASAATPSKDAWKGLFSKTSKISAEATVGHRRKNLLTQKAVFDADCQEFHDYYLEHLKYDFRAEWMERKNDQRTWPQKYEAHRDAIVNGTDEKKKKKWAKAAAAEEPSKDAWKGLFGTTSKISAEATVGERRSYLLAKPVLDDDCQEFHEYYLEHLKYDFRANWEENKKKQQQKKEKKRTKPG